MLFEKTHLHPQVMPRNLHQAKGIFQSVSQLACWNWDEKNHKMLLTWVANKEKQIDRRFFVKVPIITPTLNILKIPVKVQFSVVTLASTLFEHHLFELSKGNSQCEQFNMN